MLAKPILAEFVATAIFLFVACGSAVATINWESAVRASGRGGWRVTNALPDAMACRAPSKWASRLPLGSLLLLWPSQSVRSFRCRAAYGRTYVTARDRTHQRRSPQLCRHVRVRRVAQDLPSSRHHLLCGADARRFARAARHSEWRAEPAWRGHRHCWHRPPARRHARRLVRGLHGRCVLSAASRGSCSLRVAEEGGAARWIHSQPHQLDHALPGLRAGGHADLRSPPGGQRRHGHCQGQQGPCGSLWRCGSLCS